MFVPTSLYIHVHRSHVSCSPPVKKTGGVSNIINIFINFAARKINTIQFMKVIIMSALIVCLSLVNLTAQEPNANLNAKLKYYISKMEDGKESFHTMLDIYDSVISIYAIQGNDVLRVRYMIDKAKLASRNGEYAKAFGIYTESLHLINSKSVLDEESVDTKKDCMYQMSKMAMNMNMYDESIAQLFDLLEYNRDENINYTANAYSMLSIIFFNIDKLDVGEEYINKAKEIVRTVDTLNDYSLFSFYGNYAGLFYFKMEYDSAIKYLSKSEEYTKRLNNNEFIGNIYHNFAIIYQGISEYKIAEEYFMRILDLNSKDKSSYLNALALQNLAFLCKSQGERERAMSYYNKALEISSQVGASKIKASVLIEMSDILYENGEYKRSRDYLEQGRRLKDSVFNTQNMDRITILTNRFETRNEKIERELLEKTLLASELGNKNKTIILSVLVIIFLLFIIAMLVSFSRLMSQRKANKKLSDAMVELQQKTQENIESSKHELETTIDVKNRELTSTALCLIKANEMLSTLKYEVKRLSDTKIENERNDITLEIAAVLNSYNPEQGWAEFKLYFEQVHQSFFTGLNERHSDLTHGEQRICALLVLNMSAKEIATITNRSSRTIESLIYKIRIKLNIPADTKTVCYLRQFM